MEARPARSLFQAVLVAGLVVLAILICGISLSCSSVQDDRPTMMYFSARL
jgi:hypothetical protein